MEGRERRAQGDARVDKSRSFHGASDGGNGAKDERIAESRGRAIELGREGGRRGVGGAARRGTAWRSL